MKFAVVTPFYRYENKEILIDHLRPMDIMWHPIIEEDKIMEWMCCEKWIEPYIYKGDNKDGDIVYKKLNQFLHGGMIKKDCYYSFLNDDDFYEPNLFEKINDYSLMNFMWPVIVVSMKRGDNVISYPDNPIRNHPTNTLYADKNNMMECGTGVEQLIIRGDLLKELYFDESIAWADGKLARSLVEKDIPINYMKDIFVWFNYLEKGRWINAT